MKISYKRIITATHTIYKSYDEVHHLRNVYKVFDNQKTFMKFRTRTDKITYLKIQSMLARVQNKYDLLQQIINFIHNILNIKRIQIIFMNFLFQ